MVANHYLWHTERYQPAAGGIAGKQIVMKLSLNSIGGHQQAYRLGMPARTFTEKLSPRTDRSPTMVVARS